MRLWFLYLFPTPDCFEGFPFRWWQIIYSGILCAPLYPLNIVFTMEKQGNCSDRQWATQNMHTKRKHCPYPAGPFLQRFARLICATEWYSLKAVIYIFWDSFLNLIVWLFHLISLSRLPTGYYSGISWKPCRGKPQHYYIDPVHYLLLLLLSVVPHLTAESWI